MRSGQTAATKNSNKTCLCRPLSACSFGRGLGGPSGEYPPPPPTHTHTLLPPPLSGHFFVPLAGAGFSGRFPGPLLALCLLCLIVLCRVSTDLTGQPQLSFICHCFQNQRLLVLKLHATTRSGLLCRPTRPLHQKLDTSSTDRSQASSSGQCSLPLTNLPSSVSTVSKVVFTLCSLVYGQSPKQIYCRHNFLG